MSTLESYMGNERRREQLSQAIANSGPDPDEATRVASEAYRRDCLGDGVGVPLNIPAGRGVPLP